MHLKIEPERLHEVSMRGSGRQTHWIHEQAGIGDAVHGRVATCRSHHARTRNQFLIVAELAAAVIANPV